MNHNDEIYREKYLRYKQKYMDLKTMEQDAAGVFTSAMADAINGYKKKAEKHVKDILESIHKGELDTVKSSLTDKKDQEEIKKILDDKKKSVMKKIEDIKATDKFTEEEKEEKKTISLFSKEKMKKVKIAVPNKDYTNQDYEDDVIGEFDGDEGASLQDVASKWFKTKMDEKLKEILDKLTSDDTIKSAQEDQDYKSIEGDDSSALVKKINYLRKIEAGFGACKKVGLPENASACTPKKVSALKGIDEEIKKLEDKFKAAEKEISDIKLDKVDLIMADDKPSEKIKAISEELSKIKEQQLKDLADKYGLADIDLTKAEEVKKAIADKDREYQGAAVDSETKEQEGGEFYLPDFLTETPNH